MHKVSSGHLLFIHTFYSIQWFCLRAVNTLIRLRGMRRLIWAIAVRICPKTGFRMARPVKVWFGICFYTIAGACCNKDLLSDACGCLASRVIAVEVAGWGRTYKKVRLTWWLGLVCMACHAIYTRRSTSTVLLADTCSQQLFSSNIWGFTYIAG